MRFKEIKPYNTSTSQIYCTYNVKDSDRTSYTTYPITAERFFFYFMDFNCSVEGEKKKNGRNLKHDTFLMHSLVAPHYNSCRHLLWGLYGVLCEIIILIIGIGMCVLSLTFAFTRLALLALLLKCVVLLFCGNFLFVFCATFFWNVIIGLHHNYKPFYLSLPRKTVNHWGH